jgi:hypothetical protein
MDDRIICVTTTGNQCHSISTVMELAENMGSKGTTDSRLEEDYGTMKRRKVIVHACSNSVIRFVRREWNEKATTLALLTGTGIL